MKIWKDDEGREWQTKITVRTVKDVKDALGVTLTAIDGDDDIFTKLSTDVCLLCDVLYIVHKAQCEERKITDEAFGELLFGDSLDRASTALTEALIDFFPCQTRQLLTRAMAIGKKEAAKALDKATQALAKAETEYTVDAGN